MRGERRPERGLPLEFARFGSRPYSAQLAWIMLQYSKGNGIDLVRADRMEAGAHI
jgi:hypothetical protein